LFRVLLRVPRPTLPVLLPLSGAEGGAFFARALTSLEVCNITDESELKHLAIRSAHERARFIAAGLYDDEGPVFYDPAEVLDLDEDTFLMLSAVVLPALWTISPVYGLIDSEAWVRRLKAGAEHPSNMRLAYRLAMCRDGWNGAPRPERYFGLPVCELTDGHWLCYDAAKRMAEGKG
jgi:hypothetical protein